MDTDTDLFVQAFWTKCREVIRPELDLAAARIEGKGRRAGFATQEYEAEAAATDGAMPSLTLSLSDDGAARGTLEFTGDVAHQTVVVSSSGPEAGKLRGSHEVLELAEIDTPKVRAIIEGWL